LKLVIPVESIVQNKGGVILYDPFENKIVKQYVHNRTWKRVGWRGGVIYGKYLIATDWNELHYFNLERWEYEKSFRKNTFNDLHYLLIRKDKLFVVNTGLDAIEIFEDPFEPKFLEIIFVFKSNPKKFRPRKINLKLPYNEEYKLKPHSCHPNCISFDSGFVFVTCFQRQHRMGTGEVVELKTGRTLTKKRYDLHDGVFYKGNFYLSVTRSGRIMIFREMVKKLKQGKWPLFPNDVIVLKSKGWWRGIAFEGDTMFIFSSCGYNKTKRPARIAIVDLTSMKRVIKRLPVVDRINWDTVYQPCVWEDEK